MASKQGKTIVKILLLGDGAVGKTSLRKEYSGEGYKDKYSMTMGAEFSILRAEDSIIQIYDLAGQANFKPVRSNYYQGSQGAILVFDVTKRESFRSLDAWIQELNMHVSYDIPLIVVGNKIDLREVQSEEVPTDEVKDWISDLERSYKAPILYLETSVVDQYQVFDVFKNLISMISGELVDEVISTSKFGHLTSDSEISGTDTTNGKISGQSFAKSDDTSSQQTVETSNETPTEESKSTHDKVPEPRKRTKGQQTVDEDHSPTSNNKVSDIDDKSTHKSSNPGVISDIDSEKAKETLSEMFDPHLSKETQEIGNPDNQQDIFSISSLNKPSLRDRKRRAWKYKYQKRKTGDNSFKQKRKDNRK